MVDFGQRLDIDSVPKNKEGLPRLFLDRVTLSVSRRRRKRKKKEILFTHHSLGDPLRSTDIPKHTPLSFFCNRNETLRGRGQEGGGGGESRDGVGGERRG